MTDAPRAPRLPTLTEQQKKDWVINRQGKDFVLYAALLEIAHNQFQLSGIRTKLVQIPGPENGHVAICTAEVDVAHGTFSGTGDASPENVSRQMATVLIRFAETRAKARALRDAVNASAWDVEGDPDGDTATVQPTMAEAKREFEQMLGEPEHDNRTSYGLAITGNQVTRLIDGKPVPAPSLRAPSEPRGRSLTERAAVPVNQDAGTVDLRTARAKWNATVVKANGLDMRIPVMTDAQMADVSELLIEGRKLGRAIRMKEQERLGLTGEQRPGE